VHHGFEHFLDADTVLCAGQDRVLRGKSYHLLDLTSGSKKLLVNAPYGMNQDWHSYLVKASWSADSQSLLLPSTFFPLNVSDDAFQLVLPPAGDAQETGVVEDPEVTGAEEAVGGERRVERGVEVADAELRAVRLDLPLDLAIDLHTAFKDELALDVASLAEMRLRRVFVLRSIRGTNGCGDCRRPDLVRALYLLVLRE